ncbi:MAG: NAD-dependent epimerase/dehydratase family protein [Methylococcales bacterium]
MRCLIPGGGGFIGSFLADRLLALGHTVRIFERPRVVAYRAFGAQERVEWLAGDFQSTADIDTAVDGSNVVFHLVSTTLPKNSNDDPIYDVETNLVGTLRLLAAAVRCSVKKVVFISSGGTVYGIPAQIPIREEHPTEPLVSYGIAKLAIEKYLHLYWRLHGLDYCILRVANPFGERQRVDTAQGAVAVFLSKALSKQAIEIWGDGSVTRDYIYIDDLIDAFIRAMDHDGEARVFNIGSGTGRSLNQLLRAIEDLLGHPIERRYLPARQFDVPVNVLDIVRAHDVLGWQPRVPFNEALRRTLVWMKKN